MSDQRTTAKESDGVDEEARAAAERVPGLLVVFAGSRAAAIPVPIRSANLELGRDDPALSANPDPLISRRHLAIRLDGGRFLITDLGNSNGTSVDGSALRRGVPQRVARVIRIGHTLLLPLPDVGPYLRRGASAAAGRVEGSPQQSALRSATDAARSGRTLCITGESGTGKETLARAFHAAGAAPTGPFVAVRCGAILGSTVENLLFGTGGGAGSPVDGYLRAAHGGTLLIEDVAELPPAVQARLLHVIETGEVLPVGATRPEKVDLRICFSGRRPLHREVKEGRLRDDLYFRIAAPQVTTTPLRRCPEEITWLVQAEVESVAPALSVHASLAEACLNRDWPGNVREILAEVRSAAQRALALAAPGVEVSHLGSTAGAALSTLEESLSAGPLNLSAAPVASSQIRARLSAALDLCGGNVSAAARELGVHRTQLRRWLTRYQIDPHTFSASDDGSP